MGRAGRVVIAVVVAACGPAGEAPSGSGPGWVDAAERVRPSVHSVWGSRPALEGRARAFGPLGTAFVIDAAGLLATNAHVVLEVEGPVPRLHVLIQTDSGTVLNEARIVAADTALDLALLAVPDTALEPVRWRNTEAPMGEPLATIGYGLPEGGIIDTTGARVTTRFTVYRRFTAGYSSGYRTLEAGDPTTNVLEVDLFLFPGVSGGPAFDLEGRVLGMNRGHRRLGLEATSYGHVIPWSVVRGFLDGVGLTPVAVDST